jgi:LuxR family maltose regulon positive regulatory protein
VGRRSFLLRAAVLGRFTAELCDAVLDRSDSAAVLNELEDSNMFVLSLERREWFRVHALFAQFAAAQLGAAEPTVPEMIHRRAADWLRSRGLAMVAVHHAAAAGDPEVVAELLSEYHLALIRYFAGDLDGARSAASRAIEHPAASRRAPDAAVAHAVRALVAADHGRLSSARDHGEAARAIVGRITSSRSWLGSTVAEALGAVLAAEGDLTGAEREFSYAERFLEDEVATADATLRRARDELAELSDRGAVPVSADEVEAEIEHGRRQASNGTVLELPSEAELAVLPLLATDLSSRQIGAQLFLSPNTVRSHIRSIYRKLGVGSREDAVAMADTVGLLSGTQSPR